MDGKQSLALIVEINHVFNPSAPVEEKDLFAGRRKQMSQLVDAISQRGQHAVIYGERGVGKTSLANVLTPWLESAGKRIIAPRINAGNVDSFSGLWKKIFFEVQVSRDKRQVGFVEGGESQVINVADRLPRTISPDDIRRVLTELAGREVLLVMIVDEFDQITDDKIRKMFSDTIKTISDHSVPATIILVGVARNIDELITEHRSVERAIVQIHLPRMRPEELSEIIDKGIARLSGMQIDPPAQKFITSLSQGLPYYTHMLALHIGRAAIARHSWKIEMADVKTGIQSAIDSTLQSLRDAFHKATSSPQKDNLYTDVLTACALANRDEMECFTAADVREPMRRVTEKQYDIANYVQHLTAFCDSSRGVVLERIGKKHSFRYRFSNPLMQPFVVLRAVANGRVNLEWLQ